jgi:hypothetical protein
MPISNAITTLNREFYPKRQPHEAQKMRYGRAVVAATTHKIIE